MKVICWLKTIWYSIGTFPDTLSGHNFIEAETYDNVTVEILKCKDCGKQDIGWSK